MKKTRIGTLAKELKMDVNLLIKMKGEKLSPSHFSGFGKNTWLFPAGVELLRLAVAVPLAVPTRLRARVIRSANNPRWVDAKLDGIDGKVPVSIPLNLRGLLVGKNITVEAITDAYGETTYRHVHTKI